MASSRARALPFRSLRGLAALLVVLSLSPMGSEAAGATRTIHLTGTLRDFQRSHPDMQRAIAFEPGLVEPELGADGKPVYARGPGGSRTTSGPDSFDQWYRDVPGVNLRFSHEIPLTSSAANPFVFTYASGSFFPLDGRGWGHEGFAHNYFFTYEVHNRFTYRGGESFTFVGDDDVWVFINGQLVIDIGGVHGASGRSVSLDSIADDVDIEVGGTYDFHLFFAERYCCGSNFRITTSIELERPCDGPADDCRAPSRLDWIGDREGDHDDPVRLAARLSEESTGEPVPGVFVQLGLDGATCKAPTDADGEAECWVTVDAPAGAVAATALFGGSFRHEPTETEEDFTVTAEEAVALLTTTLVQPAGDVALSARLLEDGALPLAGRPLTFAAGSTSAPALTDADGRAETRLRLEPGTHSLSVTFAGDAFHEGAVDEVELEVLAPRLVMRPLGESAEAGRAVELTALLLDDGAPRAGRSVTFEIVAGPNAGAAGSCAPCVTGADGRASWTHEGATDVEGRDVVRVSLDGTDARATMPVHRTRRHPTQVRWLGPTAGDHHDAVELAARLLDRDDDSGVPDARLELRLGAETCLATTDGDGLAACDVTPAGPAGTVALGAAFAGDSRYLPATLDADFRVTHEETVLAQTTPEALEVGDVLLTAYLREDGALDLRGRPVRFTAVDADLGDVFTADGLTDASGLASVRIDLPAGEYRVAARFRGDAFHEAASAPEQVLWVYEFQPFVIWGGNRPVLSDAIGVGETYQFWGARWESQVEAGDFTANPSFKGWAAEADREDGAWRSRPGNSSRPPRSIPRVLGLIVSTSITKDGPVESGDIPATVVVRVVDPAAYRPDPGHAAFGTVVTWVRGHEVPADWLPGQATDVVAVAANGAALVSWTRPTHEGERPLTGFVVVAEPSGVRAAAPASETTRTVTGLPNGAPQVFRVVATNDFGHGGPSRPSAAVTPARSPDPPSEVEVEPGDGELLVSWTRPPFDGGAPLTAHTVRLVPGGAEVSVPASVTSWTIRGLENGVPYRAAVHSSNGVGVGPESEPSRRAVPRRAPEAPTAVVAAAGDGDAVVAWAFPADEGGLPVDRQVVHVVGAGSVAVGADRVLTRVPGLANGRPVAFTVAASSVAGDSAASGASADVVPFGVPAAPAGATGERGNTSAVARWSVPVSDGGAPIVGYLVTPSPGGSPSPVSVPDGERLVTALANGVDHEVVVRAVNRRGDGPDSPPSPSFRPATVPDPVRAVVAVDDDASATVTWEPPASDGGEALVDYLVVTDPESGGSEIVDAATTSVTLSGLVNGREYVALVRARNAIGPGPDEPSNPFTPARPPDAPQDVIATIAGDAAVHVSWAPPADDGGAEVTRFVVTSSPEEREREVGPRDSSARFEGLTVGTSYTFSVFASNRKGDGPSAESAPVTAATVPGQVTDVTATPADGEATVCWNAPASDGHAPLTEYRVQWTPGGGSWPALPDDECATIPGLTNGVSYTFTVVAINVVGAGPVSEPSPPATPQPDCLVPTLVALSVTPAELTGGDGAQGTVSLDAPACPGGLEVTLVTSDPAVTVAPTVFVPAGASGAPFPVATSPVSERTDVTVSALAGAVELRAPVIVRPEPIGPGPVVEILDPVEVEDVHDFRPVVGTAESATLETWVLESRLVGGGAWAELARGDTPVTAGELAIFDPTLQLNGMHQIRLTATDESGRRASDDVHVVVKGQQKIGHFTISYIDLTLPLAGIPIQVMRTYDSRDERAGDFGHGWTLDVRSGRFEKNGIFGNDWRVVERGSRFFRRYYVEPTAPHLLTVTFPNGKVYSFEPVFSPQGQLFVPDFGTISYRPVRGTRGSLADVGTTVVGLNGSVGPVDLFDVDSGDVYDPQGIRLTVEDGKVYEITLEHGVRLIEDPNGNRIDIGPDGIIASPSGVRVDFVRDASGQIESIVDPRGNAMSYGRDAAGDLVEHVDREGNRTTYGYLSDPAHHLEEIHDPLGRRPVRNEYVDGRLVRIIDARGNVIELGHDLAARREVVTDRRGNPTVFEYDSHGNVLEKTDAEGHVWSYSYDAEDNLSSETDPLGNVTTYEWTDGNPTRVVDALGQAVTASFGPFDHVASLTLAGGQSWRFERDADGNLLREVDPEDRATTVEVGADGMPRRVTSRAGFVHELTWSRGHLLARTDPGGTETLYERDANGNAVVVTRRSADGERTEAHEYDRLDRLVRTVLPDGNEVRTRYDGTGQVVARVDALGRETRSVRDELGLLARIEYPDGTHEELERDASGNVIAERDRAGRVTRHEYDGLDRRVRTVFPDGSSVSVVHDAAGRVVERRDERGHVTRYEHDALGRRTKVIEPAPFSGEILTEYDANGLVSAVVDQLGRRTELVRDANGDVLREIRPDGTERLIERDADGRVVAETDAAGHVTSFEVGSDGLLAAVDDALGGLTRYERDGFGAVARQVDALGRTTLFAHDALGRLSARTLPLGQTESVIRDAVGNVVRRVDFNGDATDWTRDAADRVLTRTHADGTSVAFTYADDGLRRTATDARGTTRHAHDARGRLRRVDNPDGSWIVYGHDAAGNRTLLSTPAGDIGYTYDALNRLETVTDWSGRVTRYTYDAVGSVARVDHANGAVETYQHDALDRLVRHELVASDGRVLARHEYEVDADGLRLAVTERSGRRVEYGYDALHRLVRETILEPGEPPRTIEHAYDAVGNRVSRVDTLGGGATSAYDDNDRLLSDGDATYFHDDAGRLIRREDAGGVTSYAWDGFDRLVAVGLPDGTVEYEYDADGLLVRMSESGDVTTLLVDANRRHAQVVREDGPAGTTRHLHGLSRLSRERDGVAEWFVADGLGSTRALVDGAENVTARFTYEAYGALLDREGSSDTSYLFAGERQDASTGLYSLRARWMDPRAGRFLSQDPWEGSRASPLTLHRYLYAGDSPTNYVDPSGRNFSLPSLAVSVAIGAIIGGMWSGTIGYLESDGDIDHTLREAGKGLIVGAITGAGGYFAGLGIGAAAKIFLNRLAAGAAGGTLGRLGDFFWKAYNFGPNRAGTLIPESFTLEVGGTAWRVVPNATKHMAEYARSTGSSWFPISPFAGAVESASARGLVAGRNFLTIGEWELGIDSTAKVIYHALYRPF